MGNSFGQLPDKLLFDKNTFRTAIEEARKNNHFENAKSLFISLIVTLFSIIIPAPVIFSSFMKKLQEPMSLAGFFSILLQVLSTVGFFGMLIFSFVKMIYYWKNRKSDSKRIEDFAQMRKIKYTVISVVADRSSDEPRFLLGKNPEHDSEKFLPFFSPKDDSEEISGPKEDVAKCLKAFNIEKAQIISTKPLLPNEPKYSIKTTTKDTGVEEHALYIYSVTLDRNARDLLAKPDVRWVTLEELKKDPLAMARNSDVIDLLEQHQKDIDDAFTGAPLYKIIWNITNKCRYNCAICATKDTQRNELDFKGKLAVLNSLVSIRNRIDTIDFSGGDPCIEDEDLSIIQTAVSLFGASKVSVTTTSKGLQHACASPKYRHVVKRCEVTIDAGTAANAAARGKDGKYCKDNIDAIKKYIPHIDDLTINIPLISSTCTDDEIDTLVRDIAQVKKNYRNHSVNIHVNLLRLMPVGNAQHDYPENYNPKEPIASLIKQLRSLKIDVDVHCSLKGADCLSNVPTKTVVPSCFMMSRKIGIDCAGDVFTCGWAGYVPNDNSGNNPFRLGNAAESELVDILSVRNERYETIKITMPNAINYCPVASYFFDKQRNWHINSDPLHKQQST